MAGPPGHDGQQHLPNQDKDAMGGAHDQPHHDPNPNDAGYKYSRLGTDRSDESNKEVYKQASKNGHDDGHQGPEYTGATSSHYKVNIDDLRKIHKQLDDMVEAADQDRNQARRIREAQPPASDEDGSVMHATALQKWGKSLHDEAHQHYASLKQYRDNIKNIVDNYSASEHDAIVTFKDFQGKL